MKVLKDIYNCFKIFLKTYSMIAFSCVKCYVKSAIVNRKIIKSFSSKFDLKLFSIIVSLESFFLFHNSLLIMSYSIFGLLPNLREHLWLSFRAEQNI